MALVSIIPLLVVLSLTSCRLLPKWQAGASGAPHTYLPNPMTVPLVDRTFIMDQVADELDDYFRISREERVRLVDGLLTEGWIETHFRIGATALEPWRRDSTPGYQRMLSTLQTVRRNARVRIIPQQNSYLVDVQVFQELEDLVGPSSGPVSGELARTDTGLDSDELGPGRPNPLVPESQVINRGWIPLGRDVALEQRILQNIRGRLSDDQHH